MDSGPLDEMIPIAFALCVSAIVGLAIWIQYRMRRLRLEVLKEALTQRDDLDLDTLKALVATPYGRVADLRRGALWFAVALSGFLFSFALPAEAQRVILGLLAFPAMIGLTFLAFHIFRVRPDRT
ncbi:MAG: hypothetical protein AAFX54_03550 [Pseudomonadota bacterium]